MALSHRRAPVSYSTVLPTLEDVYLLLNPRYFKPRLTRSLRLIALPSGNGRSKDERNTQDHGLSYAHSHISLMTLLNTPLCLIPHPCWLWSILVEAQHWSDLCHLGVIAPTAMLCPCSLCCLYASTNRGPGPEQSLTPGKPRRMIWQIQIGIPAVISP